MAKWGRSTGKPSTPEEIMARRIADRQRQLEQTGEKEAAARDKAKSPEKWGVDEATLVLPANENVFKDRELGGVRRRSNCFELLYRRYNSISAEAYEVANRLQNDLTIRYGLDGGRDIAADKVDECGTGGDAMDRRIGKAMEMDWLKERVSQKSWNLLMRIIEPDIHRGQVRVWSVIVAQESGESDPRVLSALVRWALDEFGAAYAQLDKLPAAERAAR